MQFGGAGVEGQHPSRGREPTSSLFMSFPYFLRESVCEDLVHRAKHLDNFVPGFGKSAACPPGNDCHAPGCVVMDEIIRMFHLIGNHLTGKPYRLSFFFQRDHEMIVHLIGRIQAEQHPEHVTVIIHVLDEVPIEDIAAILVVRHHQLSHVFNDRLLDLFVKVIDILIILVERQAVDAGSVVPAP